MKSRGRDFIKRRSRGLERRMKSYIRKYWPIMIAIAFAVMMITIASIQ